MATPDERLGRQKPRRVSSVENVVLAMGAMVPVGARRHESVLLSSAELIEEKGTPVAAAKAAAGRKPAWQMHSLTDPAPSDRVVRFNGHTTHASA